MHRSSRRVAIALAVALAALLGASTAAQAEPAADASASAFGATITGGGEDIVPPTPEVSVRLGEEASETLIDVPAEPLAVSGTLTAAAAAHEAADLGSALTVKTQELEGPYNVAGVAVVEELEVLVNQVDAETSLLTAAVVRAEAVGVCVDGSPAYAASSEIIDLRIAGEQVPLNEPVEQLIDGVNQVLADTGLNQVVDIQRDVVTENPAGGIAVDALVVTLLAAAGDEPLAQVRIAHGEVGPLDCAPPPACSDGIDNDGDGLIDFGEDPGCESAQDDDETDLPQCSDGVDNDGDDLVDFGEDPGCESPEDDDERDQEVLREVTDRPLASLPNTGADGGALAGAALALGGTALGATWLRRRLGT